MKKFSLSLVILFFSAQSFAIKIIQTKGNKVLLDLEEESVSIDQKLYLLNSKNKKIAIVSIIQSKSGKAIAVLNKGKLEDVTSVALMTPSPVSAETSTSEDATSSQTANNGVYRLNSMKISGLLTIGMNSMNTKQTDISANQEDVPLSGTSIGLTGAIDYPLNNWLTLRGTLGYEPFNVSGTSRFLSCNGLSSTDCNAMINYLSAGGYARYDITKSRMLIWVAAGGATKFPMGNSTTALKSDDIKMTFTFAGAVGLDFFINNKTYIPASLEYQLFQSSDTVSANIILIRAGYGWAF